MALIGLRGGGEHGNLIGWAAASTALTRDPTTILTGMGGPASIKHNGTQTTVSRFVFAGGAATTEYSTVYFSFKVMLPDVSAPSATQTFRWLLTNNGNLNVGGVRVAHNVTTGTFTLQALNADLSNAGSIATGNYFTAGQTHVVSGKFVAGATGSIEINIDGVNVIPTTTINTTSSYPAGLAGGFSLAVAGTAHTRVYHYGDWVFDDAAYPPRNATVIARQFKAGTPTYDGFVLVGGGSKHANISETPPSAVLAVATIATTAQVIQTCLINSFSATETGKGSGVIAAGDNLLGVRPEAYCKASAGNLGHTRLRLGGVDTDAQVQNVTASDSLRWGVPKTGVLLADLNAGEAGFVKPDSTPNARTYTVEDMWVLAAYAPGVTGNLAATETGADTAAFAGSVEALPTDWVTSFVTGTSHDSAGWAGYTARQYIGAANLSTSGSATRVTLASAETATTVYQGFIGHRTGGDPYDFTETPVPLKVGGATSFEIPAGIGNSVVTDELPFALDHTKDVVISLTFTAGGTLRGQFTSAPADLQGYYLAGFDAATMDASGYTAEAYVLVVQEIEVLAVVEPSDEITGTLAATETGPDIAVVVVNAEISGTLSGTETGADVAVLVANAAISGSLAGTETGPDTAALSGTVRVAGNLAATETGPDTAALAGTVRVAGNLAATETGPDTASLAGTVSIAGSLTTTETGPDTASLAGSVKVAATLAATESGADTAALAGTVAVNASLAATEAGLDSAAFTASVRVSGSLAVSEAGLDTAGFQASVSCTGHLAATEVGADQATFVASSYLIGSLAAVEVGPDTASIILGQQAGITGFLDADEVGLDTASVAGAVRVTGTIAAGEIGADLATLAGSVTVRGTLAASEVGSDQAALAATVRITGSLSSTEAGADTASLAGTVRTTGSLAATEVGSDTAFINLGVPTNNAVLAAQETGPDTAAFTGSVARIAVLAATETGPDTLSASLSAIITGTLSGAEQGSDTASVSLQAPANAVLAATEVGPDTARITLEQQRDIQATLAATEIGSDLAAIAIGVETVATLAAFEVGEDTADFAADLFPTINAVLGATETGSDTAFVDLVTKPPKRVQFVPLTHRWANHMATDRPVPMTQRAAHTPAQMAEVYRRWGNRLPPNYTTDMPPFTPFRRRI